MAEASSLDLLAVGAHPDDAELYAGGTLALLARAGLRVGIVDLTRGERATRGTPESRQKEAASAAAVLGLAVRRTLDLGDGQIEATPATRRSVVEALRALRPRVVLFHPAVDRHPDHGRAHTLIREACFFANVGGFPAEGPRHEVAAWGCFCPHEAAFETRPDWIVDVTATFETKRAALEAYATQFNTPPGSGPTTYIGSPQFWEAIERSARRWGHLIGARYGEPFTLERPPHAEHPFVALTVRALTR